MTPFHFIGCQAIWIVCESQHQVYAGCERKGEVTLATQKILRLILGDQLNYRHSWFTKKNDNIAYVLMEIRQETDYVKHHIQKVAGFFAAMRQFADALKRKGHVVIYYRLDDPRNQQSLQRNIRTLIDKQQFTRFEYLMPDEYRLDSQLEKMSDQIPIPVGVADTEHFLTARSDVEDLFSGKKRYLMESFYRHMRKKHNLLMRDGKPEGGKWNFDQSNRQRYDGAVPIPQKKSFRNDVTQIVNMIHDCGVTTFGSIEPTRFQWPVSRRQALNMLREFTTKRLPYFGTYQDAMTTESEALFHSRLSFALNTKMLHPMEVIKAAIEHAGSASGPGVSIAQLEGFVRQILGWREYMRGIYWAHMPAYAQLNYFDHQNKLPEYYWTAETRMNCVAAAVRQSLEQAYAHHIQRLMVTGNFALLAGVHPDEVDAWYLGIYIDAIQWVEIVNTRGMSQYADGGIVATKPYISSAKYIHKMSNYCDGCFYSWKVGTGSNACPFNSLYWDFLARHRSKLKDNFRVAMMYRTLDRMKNEKREGLLQQAKQYRSEIALL